MRIALSADELTGVADVLPDELRRRGHESLLHGAYSDRERPDWAWASEAAARDVAEGKAEQAIVACWTGTGASIAANKVPGIRAALLRRRGDHVRRTPLERRQRARAQPAPPRRPSSRRSSTRGSRGPRARTRATSRTSSTSGSSRAAPRSVLGR